MTISAKRAATGGVLVGMLLVIGIPAPASGLSPTVMVRSTCTQGTNAMLTLSHDDGHVEAEIELHAREAGQVWTVRFFNEGVRELTVRRSANAEDGGGTLSVSRLLTDHSGANTIKATAVNRSTGERCVVQATL